MGQELINKLYPATIVDGDTMAQVQLNPVRKIVPRRFKSNAERRRYYRTVRNVKKVYPYLQVAKIELHDLNEELKLINVSRDRRRLIRRTEKRLFRQYEKDLRGFTVSQGKTLMTLINRETGHTTYQLVRELKGGFSAGFWQGIARLFGSSLKINYEPKGKDALLEEVISLYEDGLLL